MLKAGRINGPRVAILLPSLKFGGAERVALTLAQALEGLGATVDFLLMSREGELLAEAEAAFGVVDLECGRTRKLPHRLVKHLSETRTDILLSSFWKLNLCACIAGLFVRGTRVLLWEHSGLTTDDTPRLLYALTASLLYRKATRVICVSSGVHEDVARLTFGLGDRLTVIHNPIPAPTSAPPASGPRLGKRIAWVGRLDYPKNPGLLLEAFARIAPNTDADVIYVGDGSLRPALERRCIDLGLQDRVTFAGFHPAPYDILQDSDLLVLSSDSEGLPNVLIEALHCGLGVVSTDCGKGVHEILEGSKYGTIVPIGDAPALAAAIVRELGRPRDPRLQRRGAQQFLPEPIAARFLAAAGPQASG